MFFMLREYPDVNENITTWDNKFKFVAAELEIVKYQMLTLIVMMITMYGYWIHHETLYVVIISNYTIKAVVAL